MSDPTPRDRAIEAMARAKITPVFFNGGETVPWEIWRRMPDGRAELVEMMGAATSYRDALNRQEQIIARLRALVMLDALLAILPELGLTHPMPVEATDEMTAAALRATMVYLNLPGSALTQNHMKACIRFRAMIAAAPNPLAEGANVG